MTNQHQQSIKPGEIRLDLIPLDWPLTPLGGNKDPYIQGWQNKPFSVYEIEKELTTGDCKAIGVLGGPIYNLPYGLVWVDIDGPSVYKLVEELSGLPLQDALPSTLTIFSGKIGRERKLYKLPREKQQHFLRNKYTWHAEENKEKLEILWKKHQGVLMGIHPETDGYYTGEGLGFEWVDKLPDFPDWLLTIIIGKNVKQGKPAEETSRFIGANFAVVTSAGLERDIQTALEATWAMPPEAADDYDIWIIVGQTLHDLDDSLLDEWDKWSSQSDKYKEGECHKRWLSFSKNGGRGLGTLIHTAKQQGWVQKQDHKALSVDDELLEKSAEISRQLDQEIYEEMEQLLQVNQGQASGGQQNKVEWSNKPKPKNKRNENKDEEDSQRNPSSDKIADVLFGMYEGDLRYSQTHGQFFIYAKNTGLWSPFTKIEMFGDIRNKMKQLVAIKFLPAGFSSNKINDMYLQLQSMVPFSDWYDGSDYLLFTNGVLDVQTKELLPFTKELYMTQQMPYEYDPAATCEEIIKWLKHTQHGNWERAQVLRAWLRATLLSRYEIQKFVEIVGPGKSGKSTYANIAVALVGKQNAYSTDFENLEKNRFEAASYMGKKLLLFQDADRWGGSVSKLKAITGNDWIRSERKYQSESQDPFQYHGVVMITANEAIQSTDYTSGLARRRLTIPFDRPFEGGQAEQRELIKFDSKGNPQGVFAPLLPGLVNWLLDMTEEEMRLYLMETGKHVDFFQKYEKMQSLRSNPLLDWMEHNLVFDPNNSCQIGFCKANPGGGANYYNWNSWLYPNYAEFCRSCNVGTMSRSRFEPLFLDICKHQLKINVYSKKNVNGLRIFNVGMRDGNPTKYEGYPSMVEVASNPEKYQPFYGVNPSLSTGAKMENIAEEL
jgi:P4 family phage/plasmid primase-like protien